jgi:hypothetical protein
MSKKLSSSQSLAKSSTFLCQAARELLFADVSKLSSMECKETLIERIKRGFGDQVKRSPRSFVGLILFDDIFSVAHAFDLYHALNFMHTQSNPIGFFTSKHHSFIIDFFPYEKVRELAKQWKSRVFKQLSLHQDIDDSEFVLWVSRVSVSLALADKLEDDDLFFRLPWLANQSIFDHIANGPRRLLDCCIFCSKPIQFKKRQATLCGRCRLVRYCDQDCQRKDWANHKTTCDTSEKRLELEDQNLGL